MANKLQPDTVEIVNVIKDMHSGKPDCRECKVPHPCKTYAYVDGLLTARFETHNAARSSARRIERMTREEESFYSDGEYEAYPED